MGSDFCGSFILHIDTILLISDLKSHPRTSHQSPQTHHTRKRLSPTITMNELDSTTTAATTSTTSRLHLMSLPQELQDIIFALAYCRSPDVYIVGKCEWNTHQYGKPRDPAATGTFILQPYLGDKVADFLVSKRYFVAAAKAYVSSRPLHLSQPKDPISEHFWTGGVLGQFARDAVGGRHALLYLFRMASIMHFQLQLRVFEVGPADLDTMVAFERSLSEDEIETWRKGVVPFHLVTGLSSLDIVVTDLADYEEDHELGENQLATFNANVKRCQALLISSDVTGKIADPFMASDSEKEEFTPLYAESKVGFQTCAVRRIVSRREIVKGLGTVAKAFTGVLGPGFTSPLVEATVVEMINVFRFAGDTAELSTEDRAALQQTTTLRARAEEKLRATESKLLHSEYRRHEAERMTKLMPGFVLFVLIICWLVEHGKTQNSG